MRGKLRFNSSGKISVLLLGDGGILSLSVARSLAEKGVNEIHEFSVNPVEVEMSKNSRHIRSYQTFNRFEALDPDQLAETYRDRNKLVLLPVTVEACRWLSIHQSRLESRFYLPPLTSPELLDLVSNKLSLHQWMLANHLDAPKTIPLNERDASFYKKLDQLGYPAILKSQSEIPYKNIFYIHSRESLDEIKKRLKGPPEANIIQEVIPGVDRDFSLLAQNGKLLAYTMQTPVATRELIYATSIKIFHDSSFVSQVRNMISRLKWSGVAHLDFRYNPDKQKYYLIDFNPRYWGTLLGSVCSGVNIPYMQVMQALNKNTQSPAIQPIVFMMNRDALSELQKRVFRKAKPTNGFSWMNSELRYTLFDPLPEISRRYRNHSG